jgi:hypothetical protein
MRVFALLLLAVTLMIPSGAGAGLLLEGRLDGAPIRITVGAEGERVLVVRGEQRHLVDLDREELFEQKADGRLLPLPATAAGDRPTGGGYALTPWGPGPIVAGYVSVYHVLTLDGRTCGEVLLSPWMQPFTAPAVRAVAMLEARGLIAAGRSFGEGCARVPFAALAGLGWPMMAGAIDRPVLETATLRFDYEPAPKERLALSPPAPAAAVQPAAGPVVE